jgi:FG-GAP-like repeat
MATAAAGLARRVARAAALLVAALLPACGGGGDDAIPSFWLQSGVVAADFDGDSRVDVAVATRYIAGAPPHPGYIDVYLQTAPGVFQAPAQYAVAPDPWGLSAGDFDGDGKLDLVAATPSTVPPQVNVVTSSGVVSILRQDAANAGRFLAAQQAVTGGAAKAAAIAQLTGDAFADVVVADGVLVNGRALLLAQDPAHPGTLLSPFALAIGAGHGAEDIAVGDIDGDGRTDIALAAYDTAAVLYQDVGGVFEPVVLLPVGIYPQGIAMADLDGDGHVDIATANAGNAPGGGLGGSSVTLLLQTAARSFARTDVPVADGARRLVVADLNGDGVPDIAVVSLVYQSQAPSRISVLLQSATTRGQFSVAGTYNGTFSANFIAAGDVNGDGRNDIIVNEGPSVLLQQAAPGMFSPVQPLR